MMALEDELAGLRQMAGRQTRARCVATECERILYAWQKALLSQEPDHSLRRYFDLHVKGITTLSDTLFNKNGQADSPVQLALARLAGQLITVYAAYLEMDEPAPVVYQLGLLQREGHRIENFLAHFSGPGIDPVLGRCLSGYIRQMQQPGGISYRALAYFQRWLSRLDEVDWHSGQIASSLRKALTGLNFNHLSYLVYLQESFLAFTRDLDPAAQLEALQGLLCETVSVPVQTGLIYHPGWPPLHSMVTLWADETKALCLGRIRLARQAAKDRETEKLPLNLSVKYMAFLLRLFFKEKIFATDNLAQIFRFTARHYRSKRQDRISPDSLNMNYYTTDQQTAARVAQLLQNMINGIKADFFPVMAAIGAAAYFFPEMR